MLERFADWLVFNVLSFSASSHFGKAASFFVYDVIKIVALLLVINYLMAIIRYYLPIEKIRDFLASHKFFGFDHILAAMLGAITPFCSCSSIPLFIGFLEAGIPLGVTFSFLITSPLINEVAIVLLAGFFGWKITLFYILAALILGVIGGMVLRYLKMEKYVASYIWQIKSKKINVKKSKRGFLTLLLTFWREGWALTKKLLLYIIIGIAISSAIHGYVPTGFFEGYMTSHNIFAVPIATLVAIPLYVNSVGAIPVMQALVAKGVPLGTAMSFMMAAVALSLPEAMILKKVMKTKLLIYFFGITALSIMIIGYLFNFFFS